MGLKICTKCHAQKNESEFQALPGGNLRGTCKECRNTAARWRRSAKRNAKEHDYGNKAVPPGFGIKGVSQLVDADGNIKVQWIKSVADKESQLEMLAEAVDGLADRVGTMPLIAPPEDSNDDLCCVYPMGDPHLGMYAWAEESGADFDLKIASRNLFTAVDQLVSIAPAAKHALIINLGDFFHSDGKKNETTKGTPVDTDTRWAKVLQTGIDVQVRLINRALEKHENVTVINEIGNHDEHASIMLSLMLEMFYRENPRVSIDTSPNTFHWYRFGACLFGVTHGNGPKVNDLPAIMSVDRKKDWGETEPANRRWYTGHVHHDTVKEFPGCTVETFRTLAPKDAWHNFKGYRSERDMKCDVWHRRYGYRRRNIIGIDQIEDLQK
jgi:hypothetical protein